MISCEGIGKTIEKAIENALFELKATREDVDIKILNEGGLFKKAKVLVTISEEARAKYEKVKAVKAQEAKEEKKPESAKENKEAKATFLKENEHNFIVSEEEFMCAKSLIDSQFGVYFSQEYRSVGFVETAYFGQIFNYDFKCKPDFFIPELKLCIDLKTTTSVSELDFTRSCVAFKYYIQAFIYCKILNIPASNFVFLAIEKEPPYYASAYTLESFFDLAEKEIKESLYILENQHIYNKNVLIHSYDNKSNNVSYVKSIPLPAYLIQKLV